MKDTKIQITKEKKLQLEEELTHLETVQTNELAAELEEARKESLSDETSLVTNLLEEKKVLEKRVAEIKEILSNVEVIKAHKHKKIEIGSEVILQLGRKRMTFKLVDSIESDPLNNQISDDSPLGKLLLEAKVGDEITLDVRGKIVKYKVLKIK
jgi:transcription elongation factor GreA